MRILSRKPTIPYRPIAATLCLVVIVFGIVLSTRAHAESQASIATGQHLVTLHDNGRDRGFLTNAKTLREAFKETDIQIDPNDLVEPSLDETLVAAHYDVNVYRARPVTVIDGTLRTKILSPYQTPEQIVKHANISLQDEDTTLVSANTDMVSQGAGLQVAIDRATPFTFVLYGKTVTAYTQSKTVGEMLDQKNVKLAKSDMLSLPKETPITNGMTVELWRDGKQTITEEADITFSVEKIQDGDHEIGYKEVKTPGVVGKKTVSYEIEMKNGKEISRKEIQSVTTKGPIKQVEVVGTKMSNTFSGSFAEALARLRSCEGSYTSNTGNGYYGAYQYDISTWGNYKGYPNASVAPPAVQDEKVWETYQRRGWQPWPSCSKSQGLQDIYR